MAAVRGSFMSATVQGVLQRCFPPPLYKIFVKGEHEAVLLRLPDVEAQICCCSASATTVGSSDSSGSGLSTSSGLARVFQRARGCLAPEQQLQCSCCENHALSFRDLTEENAELQWTLRVSKENCLVCEPRWRSENRSEFKERMFVECDEEIGEWVLAAGAELRLKNWGFQQKGCKKAARRASVDKIQRRCGGEPDGRGGSAPSFGTVGVADKLRWLGKLMQDGLLTREEFERQKKSLLAN